MGLWAEMKTGNVKNVGELTASKASNQTKSPARGKSQIRETLYRIAELWSEIETCGASLAWEWILRGSPHGATIREAEDRVNAIGSIGNRAELEAACDVWLSAWRDGIEAWKQRLPAKDDNRTKQASLIFYVER